MDAAVRRRDSILAATASSTSATTQSHAASSDAASQAPPVDATAVTQSSAQISQAAPSPSQKLAQAVLAGQGAASSTTASQNADMAKLQAALSGGMGGPGSPIVVSLAERESLSLHYILSAGSPRLCTCPPPPQSLVTESGPRLLTGSTPQWFPQPGGRCRPSPALFVSCAQRVLFYDLSHLHHLCICLTLPAL